MKGWRCHKVACPSCKKKMDARRAICPTCERIKLLVSNEWDESGSDDGYWMQLKDGHSLDGASVIHEHTRKSCIARLPEVKQKEPS